MLAYLGDDVNFVFDLSLTAINFGISFIAETNICTASQIFFGVGSPLPKASRSPAACRWSFILANSSGCGSHVISDFVATTRVNICFNLAPETCIDEFSTRAISLTFQRIPNPRQLFLERLPNPNNHRQPSLSQLGRSKFLSVSCIFRQI